MRIHRIRGVFSYSYILESEGGLFLVDAGYYSQAPLIAAKVARLQRSLDDVRLAVITHGHLDHFGGLAGLQRKVTFDVGVHPEHVPVLQAGTFLVSPGRTSYGRTYSAVARKVGPRLDIPGIREVISLKDEQRLEDWGFPATVLHTPGHTEACISVLLDDGTAFVGDLVQGRRIPGVTPIERPNMAVDPEAALASWRKLLEAGARIIYPAHGSVVLRSELEKKLRQTSGAT
jgi:glyoxylase-like metal-dependent hydrolase (beta-lactamase superfamily II)